MTKRKQPKSLAEGPDFAFDPVVLRFRHDGWAAQKQVEFIQALAECGCVTEACGRVGMSVKSAYALRTRPDAWSFRGAWDAALAHAIQRLSDAAFARALHGVARPVFFQGEQVGERRHFDERLTMFMLRYRDPDRYGKWNDRMMYEPGEPDAVVQALAQRLVDILQDAGREALGASGAEGKPEGEGA